MFQAREIESEVPKDQLYAVSARSQTKGRGTRGRAWKTSANNLFLTVSVPVSRLPIPIYLVPLRQVDSMDSFDYHDFASEWALSYIPQLQDVWMMVLVYI